MRPFLPLILAATFAAGAAVAAPPPEHPTVDQASRLLGVAQASTLSNSGKVIESIDSNSYSYILVEGCQGKTWLAAPRANFTVGSTIRYGDGAVMRNFFSKALQRQFDVILFIGGTEPAPDQTCSN